MIAIKIIGRNCRALADEAARIVGKSVHYNLYAHRLEFAIEDAEELAAVLRDASGHWQRMRKPALARAAESVRELVFLEIAADRAARSILARQS